MSFFFFVSLCKGIILLTENRLGESLLHVILETVNLFKSINDILEVF